MQYWTRREVWLVTLFLVPWGELPARGQLWDNVELYFSFDQSMFMDLSGAGRNLSVVDNDAAELALSTDVPPLIGSGGSLNTMGTEDFLEALDWTGLAGTADRTVAAWIKTEDQTKTYHLVEWGTNSAGQRWTFRVNNNGGNGTLGGLRVEIQGGFIISEGALTDGEWHHIAATFSDDGTPDVEDVKLYIDGQPSNLLPPTTPNPEPLTTLPDRGVTVGGSHGFAGRGAEALLDEVVVFGRVLSPDEIFQLALGATLGEEVLPGDFDADEDVDADDFNIMVMNLGAHLYGPVTYSMGDFNFSRTIDLDDFGAFKSRYPGAVASATGVPEPANLGLAALVIVAALPLVRRRSRNPGVSSRSLR